MCVCGAGGRTAPRRLAPLRLCLAHGPRLLLARIFEPRNCLGFAGLLLFCCCCWVGLFLKSKGTGRRPRRPRYYEGTHSDGSDAARPQPPRPPPRISKPAKRLHVILPQTQSTSKKSYPLLSHHTPPCPKPKPKPKPKAARTRTHTPASIKAPPRGPPPCGCSGGGGAGARRPARGGRRSPRRSRTSWWAAP